MKNYLKNLLLIGLMCLIGGVICISCEKREPKGPTEVSTTIEKYVPPTVDEVIKMRSEDRTNHYLDSIYMEIPEDVLRIMYEQFPTDTDKRDISYYYIKNFEYIQGVLKGIQYEKKKTGNGKDIPIPAPEGVQTR